MLHDIKIGDKVSLVGEVDKRSLDGMHGTVSEICHMSVRTNMCESGKSEVHSYFGECYYIKEINWYVSRYNILGESFKRKRKIVDIKLDPFGEEDWWEEELNELNEYRELNFKVGDMVSLIGEVDKRSLDGLNGIIIMALDTLRVISYQRRRSTSMWGVFSCIRKYISELDTFLFTLKACKLTCLTVTFNYLITLWCLADVFVYHFVLTVLILISCARSHVRDFLRDVSRSSIKVSISIKTNPLGYLITV